MAIERVNALTIEQREAALNHARLRIAGDEPTFREPTLQDFVSRTTNRFPPVVTRTITLLSMFMLIVAFLPSAMRLHEIGRMMFSKVITDVNSVYVAALCIVLMAEVGVVIFSLAAATNAENVQQRRMLNVGSWVSVAIALAGNGEMVKPWQEASVFVWLETFAPPMLVLITAQILKSQMLHSIEARHAAQQAYTTAHAQWIRDTNEARAAWQAAYTEAQNDARWARMAANALRDAIRKANARSTAVLRELSDEEWRVLVIRELSAENWFERAEQIVIEREQQAQLEPGEHPSGKRTGEYVDSVIERGNVYVATCPYCNDTFENNTRRGAKAALSVHSRFCKVRNSVEVEA